MAQCQLGSLVLAHCQQFGTPAGSCRATLAHGSHSSRCFMFRESLTGTAEAQHLHKERSHTALNMASQNMYHDGLWFYDKPQALQELGLIQWELSRLFHLILLALTYMTSDGRHRLALQKADPMCLCRAPYSSNKEPT